MRIQEKYKKEIIPELKKRLDIKNTLAIPRITKVVINVGVGKKEKDFISTVEANLARITGQKPVLTKAKKAISAFKTRQGMVIGVAVTLRGKRMYDFLEKLINISFPRVRDFRGISEKHLDNMGNLTVGFKENISFPEIRADEIENIHGLEISITTTAKSREAGLELFKLLGFPFIKKD